MLSHIHRKHNVSLFGVSLCGLSDHWEFLMLYHTHHKHNVSCVCLSVDFQTLGNFKCFFTHITLVRSLCLVCLFVDMQSACGFKCFFYTLHMLFTHFRTCRKSTNKIESWPTFLVLDDLNIPITHITSILLLNKVSVTLMKRA